MNSLDEWAKLIGAVTAGLTAMGFVGQQIAKRFPPRATGLAAEVDTLRQDLKACNADLRTLSDYVHDLREHIAKGKPPPPPDWPEGLRL